jgi:CRP-like cAMP-binding protein
VIKPGQPRNQLLQRLSSGELKVLAQELRPAVLAPNTVLFESDKSVEYVYFPCDSVVSFLGDTGEGGRIELWAVGNEGVAGISAFLARRSPYPGIVQIGGTALMGRASALRNCFRSLGRFQNAILRYYETLVFQVAHLGLCNSAHSVEQRFCRWLLMTQDRTLSRTLAFTQDSIAGLLGTRRATISVSAATLQKAGLIHYTPGVITITSRTGLRARACRCYEVIKKWGAF